VQEERHTKARTLFEVGEVRGLMTDWLCLLTQPKDLPRNSTARELFLDSPTILERHLSILDYFTLSQHQIQSSTLSIIFPIRHVRLTCAMDKHIGSGLLVLSGCCGDIRRSRHKVTGLQGICAINPLSATLRQRM
jgi:hypothetical protein